MGEGLMGLGVLKAHQAFTLPKRAKEARELCVTRDKAALTGGGGAQWDVISTSLVVAENFHIHSVQVTCLVS